MESPAFEPEARPDIVYFAGQPWGYVFRRAQHLMSRAARDYRVFFIEDAGPAAETGGPRLEVTRRPNGVRVVVPHLPAELLGAARSTTMRLLLADLFARYGVAQYVFWYDTAAPVAFTRHLNPLLTVYDCAPGDENDGELLRRAQLVLAGGPTLYDVRRQQHPNVLLAPSAIDAAHFEQARSWQPEPADQGAIPHPRLGYLGPVTQGLDLSLLGEIADARPDWHLILLDPARSGAVPDLPARPNIHYLGRKSYADLPVYLAGWDVGILPLAANDATRFINPPELAACLAAGKPVVSTPLPDVVRQYGATELVNIAAAGGEFVRAAEMALALIDAKDGRRDQWLQRADEHLRQQSWEATWQTIARWLEGEVNLQRAPALARARIAQAHFGELLFSEILLRNE